MKSDAETCVLDLKLVVMSTAPFIAVPNVLWKIDMSVRKISSTIIPM